MRQHCGIFVVAPERKICVSKLPWHLKLVQFECKSRQKAQPSLTDGEHFNAELRRNAPI
jgi:hypothetical protein